MSSQDFTGQQIEYNYTKKNHSDSEINKKQVDNSNRKLLNRCKICKKKVGLLGFTCKCSNSYDDDKIHAFCALHRHPEDHNCPVDYRELGKLEIKKKNPIVSCSKLTEIN